MSLARHVRAGVAGVLLVLGLPGAASAQWADRPTAGIPRLADGKPNLQAPAARLAEGRVDLSGIWRPSVNPVAVRSLQEDIARALREVPMQPWAAKLYEERKATQGREHPRVRCLPRGVPNAMVWRGGPFKFVHTPGLTLILFEEFVTFRQVFTDGRSLPADPQPAWWGYSVGRWERDAFVIETAGFKELSWLDFDGHPATEAMRITERFRRSTVGSLELELTFDDPKAYTRPWSVSVQFELMPDTEFLEHVCENEFTYQRLSAQ
jgi:hypothetical protein